MSDNPLYQRLGGYDAIAAVADDLMVRIKNDNKLRRFYDHRGADGIAREQQLLVDFLCMASQGPMVYTGRDMTTTHKGMKISEEDWSIFLNHAGATFKALEVPKQECDDVVGFVLGLKDEIVES